MSEKLHLMEKIGVLIIEYEKAKKPLAISPEIIVDNISQRGFHRTRKVLQYCDDMTLRLHDIRLQEQHYRDYFKQSMHDKLFG